MSAQQLVPKFICYSEIGACVLIIAVFGNQQACAVHLQPRLAEFLNLAAKQLVSEISSELLLVAHSCML